MIGEIFTGLSRVAVSIAANRPTGAETERELNSQFADKEWTITNYLGEDVTLTVESISVRPKYRPKRFHEGVYRVEGNHLFTHSGDEQQANTIREKFSASYHNEWITKIQLQIKDRSADAICPRGINLSYIISQEALHFDGYVTERQYIPAIPPIRIKPTHKFQNDKLEMKARYDGEVGGYAQRLSEGIEFLDTIQEQMEIIATVFLLDLHRKGEGDTWADPERATMVAEYVYGEPVSLETLNERLEVIKTELESSDKTSENETTE